MSGATCPACGVAVLPGYVRCPKCKKPLPRRMTTAIEGGTSVESSNKVSGLVWLAAAVVIGGGTIAYFGLGKDPKKPAAPAPEVEETTVEQPRETSMVTPPDLPPTPVTREPTPTGPSPQEVAGQLEQALKRQRLWSTVTITGGRVDVRSASCGEAAMTTLLDGSLAGFKAAGLTKLRCVEQSGRVVLERDL